MPAGTTDYRKRVPGDLPSKSRLILELRALAQHHLHRTPTTTDIRALYTQGKSHSLETYYAVFGSFLVALERAKLKARYKQQFNEEEKEHMLAELRHLRKKVGRPLFGYDVVKARKKKQVSPINHFQIAFGSVPQALAAAGAGPITYTRDEIIDLLRKLQSKVDGPVTEGQINELYAKREAPNVRRI